jgi:hypothetical protein
MFFHWDKAGRMHWCEFLDAGAFMPLCREALLGPAFTPGSASGNPQPFRSALRLAAKGDEMEGGSEDTNHTSQRTRPERTGLIRLRGEGR